MVLFKFKMAKNNLVKNNKSYKSLEILQDEAVKSKYQLLSANTIVCIHVIFLGMIPDII